MIRQSFGKCLKHVIFKNIQKYPSSNIFYSTPKLQISMQDFLLHGGFQEKNYMGFQVVWDLSGFQVS